MLARQDVDRSRVRSLRGLLLLAGSLLFVWSAEGVEARQDVPPPLRGEITISEEGEGTLVLFYRSAGEAPDTLQALARAQRGDAGVRPQADGGLALHFAPRVLPEVIPPLRLARELLDEGELPVAIRVPAELRSGDIWGFQALLAQAGIRRVRMIAGDPGAMG